MANRPNKIIVHHDGVSRVGPSFGVVNEYHQSLRFPKSTLGFYCGYHYWIERDGSLRQARCDDEPGAHTVGQNWSSIGIGLAGNFDVAMPSPEQEKALGDLVFQLCTEHKILFTAVYPHRMYAEKSCYGANLHDQWAALQGLYSAFAHIQVQIESLKAAQKN